MVELIGAFTLPFAVVFIVVYGLFKRVKVFESFTRGVRNGLKTAGEIFPNITALVFAVTLLDVSGGMALIGRLFSPLAELFGVPEQVAAMAAISPISGGASMSIFENILQNYGADSFTGRVASVIMGSTDTTLYAITVYFGCVGIKKTGHTLYAGLCADFLSFALSGLFVRLTLA